MTNKGRIATLLMSGAMLIGVSLGLGGTAQAAADTPAGAPTTASATAPTAQRATGNATTQAVEYAHLSIRSLGGGNYSITVSGGVNLTVPGPATYSVKLYGDDTFFDGPPFCEKWPLTTSSTGSFWVQYTCPGSLLNEDWGQDEIYAKVFVWQSTGYLKTLQSNTVTGYF